MACDRTHYGCFDVFSAYGKCFKKTKLNYKEQFKKYVKKKRVSNKRREKKTKTVKVQTQSDNYFKLR